MKAAVLEELNKIAVKEVPIPEIAKDEMLVRVRACSICGTDVRIFHNGEHRVVTPCITGHEISGDVVLAAAVVIGATRLIDNLTVNL